MRAGVTFLVDALTRASETRFGHAVFAAGLERVAVDVFGRLIARARGLARAFAMLIVALFNFYFLHASTVLHVLNATKELAQPRCLVGGDSLAGEAENKKEVMG